MKKLFLLAVTTALSLITFAQLDSANIKLKLRFKREHLMLFGSYLQNFDDVSSYDLYSRMSNAIVTSSLNNLQGQVNIVMTPAEYLRFNRYISLDKAGEVYVIYNDIVRGSTGYIGLIEQLLKIIGSGTNAEKAAAKYLLQTADSETKDLLKKKDIKVANGAKFLFSTPAKKETN